MRLPEDFLNKMSALMEKDEYESLIQSYEKPRYYGLRINTLKISVEEFLKISPFELEPIPWVRDGFYYREGESPGKHPYYNAGLYYIQEPSAMLPGEVVDSQPGERILDLCAAPGGKTVQIAAGMKGRGILVANDISSDRVKALIKNIELCGVRNAIVTNETPQKLAGAFPEFFDKILVDAPCSGEGMFRKDQDAVKSWEKFKSEKCSAMQWDILEQVDKMLRPGGYIIYSTCTFSPEENEKMISAFLSLNNGYEVVEISTVGGMERGRPGWAEGNQAVAGTVRLWPHRVKGEGHFAALLRKKAGESRAAAYIPSDSDSRNDVRLNFFRSFAEENLSEDLNIGGGGYFDIKGSNLYAFPERVPELKGIRVAKFGWYLGEFGKNRFEPSHSMVVSLNKQDLKNTIDFACDSKELSSYLKGETLMLEGEKGMKAVCVNGYTLGWAKQMDYMLKNLYPKGWRRMS
ncbi:NOL1/NOP2/sun family putative RNA methylase [Anaerobacterium chartisolvens]|uniref:NOL1/NOP2/sun family putative RNA methylase n=1 Tax=Anaerobacterium chartisolvens TaxID=1297424 RepID=A0A369BGR7_9FIRM|nr:RsmB/NOP family class I SAM-dependent RNA methyltransferase [Anaerobacterium chartisolvens]RCX18874.1 NOL1/NOP2/sun family putative RNA methylase [Anaerobacterium chartisolvens]